MDVICSVKTKTVLILLALAPQLGSASLGPHYTSNEADYLELPYAESIGSPDTMDTLIIMQDPITDFETHEDPRDYPDLDNLSDDQVEELFVEELNFTRYWLDRVSKRPMDFYLLGQDAVAGKSGGRGMSALACMSLAIQGEASGEPEAGMLAVGQTIMARAKGKSSKVCSVIFARSQFESMLKRPKKVSAAVTRAAKKALTYGGKCTYDHFINKKLQLKMGRKIPKWVKNFEKWGCASKVIGRHTFYSSCNCKRK